jgi:hypothetical protein
MLRRKLLPTFNAIPASTATGTATCDLPLGIPYHAIVLDLGGVETDSTSGAASTLGTAEVSSQLITDPLAFFDGLA